MHQALQPLYSHAPLFYQLNEHEHVSMVGIVCGCLPIHAMQFVILQLQMITLIREEQLHITSARLVYIDSVVIRLYGKSAVPECTKRQP